MDRQEVMETVECPGPGAIGVGPKLEPIKPVAVTEAAPGAPIEVLCGGKYTLHDLFALYDMGAKQIVAKDRERWRATFALAAGNMGVWAVRSGDSVQALAVFWRTKNPHVDIDKDVPRHDSEGNYAYVGWFWSLGDNAKSVIDYIAKNMPGTEFVAWHDSRLKRKKSERGKLYVLELPPPPVTLARVLGLGNGKVAAHG